MNNTFIFASSQLFLSHRWKEPLLYQGICILPRDRLGVSPSISIAGKMNLILIVHDYVL